VFFVVYIVVLISPILYQLQLGFAVVVNRLKSMINVFAAIRLLSDLIAPPVVRPVTPG
jgi:hypothetical protein